MTSLAPSVEAVRSGDRRALAKAVTLLESRNPDDAAASRKLLEELMGLHSPDWLEQPPTHNPKGQFFQSDTNSAISFDTEGVDWGQQPEDEDE